MFTLNSTSNTSTNNVIDNLIDFSYTYIIPIICLFGIATNLIDMIVFFNKHLKDITFKYLKLNALSNLIYLLISFFIFSARCGIYCSLSKTFPSQFYIYLFYNYIKGIFALFSNCILIFVGIYRYLIVTNKSFQFFNHYKLILTGLFLFSALFYSPNLFTREIQKSIKNQTINNSTVQVYTYSTAPNELGKSELGKWLIIGVVTIFRGYITLIALIIIDIITIIKLKNHQKNSQKMKAINVDTSQNESKENESTQTQSNSVGIKKFKKIFKKMDVKNKLTFLAVSVSGLFFIGNIPNSMLYFAQQFVDTSSSTYKLATLLTNVLIFTTTGCNIFIYYSFNNQYRKVLRNLSTKFKRNNIEV